VRIASPLSIGLAAGAAAVVAGTAVAVYRRLQRKTDPVELERLRRLGLGRTGRITTGEVTGLIEPEGGGTAMLLVYRYGVGGVNYEVTQDVSTLPGVAAEAARLVGRTISVKYEIKHPTNSIVICEEWSGIRGVGLGEYDPATPLVPGPLSPGEGELESGG
jgi:hypothetical protein